MGYRFFLHQNLEITCYRGENSIQKHHDLPMFKFLHKWSCLHEKCTHRSNNYCSLSYPPPIGFSYERGIRGEKLRFSELESFIHKSYVDIEFNVFQMFEIIGYGQHYFSFSSHAFKQSFSSWEA